MTDLMLYSYIDRENDPHAIVKQFFDSMYSQGYFLKVLPEILNKHGCRVNEDFCMFPDVGCGDPECEFEGVMFGSFNEEVIVSERDCLNVIKEACDVYVSIHPKDAEIIRKLLETSILS